MNWEIQYERGRVINTQVFPQISGIEFVFDSIYLNYPYHRCHFNLSFEDFGEQRQLTMKTRKWPKVHKRTE
jgi:hypothetical protein